ncbi:hypothetical protein NMG29_36810 [Streptomyces cocklensis]|uniref:YD repeat-containing protein n=1 Tax=Actinacidiphila cocklensis TaxID=887465 RepID=A0A9W4DJ31_9ACTN|nr:hypothetical protein [Actinacidiphila cocklensis]MDD1063663.1 hypothetical protein [Actinacidiphila cocklensis]CAG6391132.1 hypothetical protein SCOCK_100198 [Actinacidiphila cocklensis]
MRARPCGHVHPSRRNPATSRSPVDGTSGADSHGRRAQGDPSPGVPHRGSDLGNTAKVTEVSGSTTRTSTTTYDPAGRPIRVSVTGGPGTAVPDTVTGYDPATGDIATLTGGGQTVTHAYDTLGRQICYADGAGNTTTTAYDALGSPVRTADSAPSTTTYTYDSAKEPRGLETSRTDSAAGTLTAAYDADARLAVQTLPGGCTLTVTHDETGATISRTCTRDSDGTTVTADEAGETGRRHGGARHDRHDE